MLFFPVKSQKYINKFIHVFNIKKNMKHYTQAILQALFIFSNYSVLL